MTPDDLAAARWFRSKQRRIGSVAEVDRLALSPDASLAILVVRFTDDGPDESYVVPHGTAWPLRLADAMAREATIAGARGALECRSAPLLIATGPVGAMESRALGVEQSNTSVVLGDRLICKLYRLLEDGENPDVEVSAFLADTGFADTPALAGSAIYRTDIGEAAVAMLQALVPSVGDGWAAMLAALAAGGGGAAELAAATGTVTARLHTALASRPGDDRFPARAATDVETAAWRASAERQLALATSALTGADHARLVEVASRIRARLADAFGGATQSAQVSRTHGDYHLGQLLVRAEGGLAVIDFEGEPARPLAERRAPTSPLRDVAGMLRSLDYAARTAERDGAIEARARGEDARATFLDAYGPLTPSDAELLAAFELEKACYEVRYEAANRPDWLWLPLAAVERLAARP